MLNLFRSQSLKNTIYGLLVLSIIIVFVVQFRPGSGSKTGTVKNECAAEVRGECVSARDFRTTLALFSRRDEEGGQAQLRRRVLDGLVERTLLVQEATRLGLALSDDELNGALTAGRVALSLPVTDLVSASPFIPPPRTTMLLPVKGSNGEFDRKTYEKSLHQYIGRGTADFRDMQQQEQLAARVRDLVRARVRISDEEAFADYVTKKSTASLRYVRFLRPWFARHAVATTPAAIEAWTNDHQDDVGKAWESQKAQFLPVCRKAHVLLVPVTEGASDDAKATARRQLEEARQRLEKGARFEEVAPPLQYDAFVPSGDLGCITAANVPKPVLDALDTLAPGQLSPVGDTDKGPFLVRLDALRRDGDAETEGRRQVTKALFLSVEAEGKAAEAAKQLRTRLAAGTAMDEALRAIVASYALPEGKTDGKPNEKKGAIAKALEKSANAAAVETAGAATNEEPAADERNDAAPNVREAKDILRDSSPVVPGANEDVAAVVFGLQKPGDVPADVIKLGDGYAVIQLTEKLLATRPQFEKVRAKHMAALLAAKQQDALVTYVARLREGAKAEIKLNPTYTRAANPAESEQGDDP